ncbi:hypothetical protein quinque_008344 [Culex quinquefasciatus]
MPGTSFRRNPRPDFDASREKLQRLGEGEGNMTKEEFKKVKEELEAEYLVTFKKMVTMQEHELQFLGEHHAHLKEAALHTEKNTNKHKEVADAHVRLPSVLTTLSTAEHGTMEKFLAKTSDIFEKFRFSEHGRPHRQRPGHIAGDTLRYYQRDSNAAKALLIRRAHSATPKKWTRKVTSRRRFASADDNMQ